MVLIGASTAFVEATLAQLYKEEEPLYGGYRCGPVLPIVPVNKSRHKKANVLLHVFLIPLAYIPGYNYICPAETSMRRPVIRVIRVPQAPTAPTTTPA